MFSRKRRREGDNEAEASESDTTENEVVNHIPRIYPPKALQLARHALIAHARGRPLKKHIVRQELDIDARDFARVLKFTQKYFRKELGMDLVELGSVPLGGTKQSTVKGEYALISLVRKYRSILSSPEYGFSQLSKWGVLCFVLMLIVIHGEGVSLQYITQCFNRSQLAIGDTLKEGDDDDDDAEEDEDNDAHIIELKEQLEPILHSLVSQRLLEVTKKPTLGPAEPAESESEDDSDIYHIGPYTPHVIKGRELYQIIVKIVFPFEDIKSSEFREKYNVHLRDLVRKINATCLEPAVLAE